MKFLEKLPTNKKEADLILKGMEEELMEMSDKFDTGDDFDMDAEEKEKELEREYNLQEGCIMIAERIFDLMFGDPDKI
jgi:hypothetical protein